MRLSVLLLRNGAEGLDGALGFYNVNIQLVCSYPPVGYDERRQNFHSTEISGDAEVETEGSGKSLRNEHYHWLWSPYMSITRSLGSVPT